MKRRVRRRKDGTICVAGLSSIEVMVLRQVPDLLGRDQPEAVRKRLFPDAFDDDERADEWRRTQHPELFALLADSKRIVESDLASLAPRARPPGWAMQIPAAHVNAWLSALNAARLAIVAEQGLTAAELEAEELELDDRGLAVVKSSVLGGLQQGIVEALGFRA
jgi:hypothetical protein